ncbi:MAG: VWA domain-containing protein [Pseudomonadota bacterium]
MTTTLQSAEGRLVENIVHFVQALRKAGLKIGTAQVETAIEAVEAVGFSHRVDFYHILRATLITRAEHLEVYHQVFSMFWRDPEFLEGLMHMLSPRLKDDTPPPPPGAARRRAEDALGGPPPRPPKGTPKDEITQEALLTWSRNEVFRTKDFEQMSAAELRDAQEAVRQLALSVDPLKTRRMGADPHGPRADLRATLRKAARAGGEIREMARKAPRTRRPDLVAICDISGSMSVYSRMLMRYLHAVTHARHPAWGRVHVFTFGTALTNVTRALGASDADTALAAIGREATDWEGGTRIGAALERFNKAWSRRVLSTGAHVLLITDGLERDDLDCLDREAARLSLMARRFAWLNPLLRYDGFAPKAGGVRTLLAHVDSFHACHSLDSLQMLTETLGSSQMGRAGRRDQMRNRRVRGLRHQAH